MRYKILTCFIAFSLLLGAPCVYSQQQVSMLTEGDTIQTLGGLAEVLNRLSDQKVLLADDRLDTVQINIGAKQGSIIEILQSATQGRSLYFSETYGHYVVVTDDAPITALRKDYFDSVAVDESFDESALQNIFVERNTEDQIASRQVVRIGAINENSFSGEATISGYVRDKESGEALLGANVYIKDPLRGTTTNQLGFYSLTIPRGKHTLYVELVGMLDYIVPIQLFNNGSLNIELEEEVVPLKEVVIEAEKLRNVNSLQMGVEKIDITQMETIPMALGEVDIIRAMLTRPGIQTVGEGASGFNVRGGAVDQNLILLNDGILYNPSHLFGFFSVVNPDVVRDVQLYKSSIPARYGGRISSVLEIVSRDGNKKEFQASGGISPVTGRLTVEGPIKKDVASFLVSGRSTYSDWLLRQVDNPSFRNSSGSFYDLHAKFDVQLSDKDKITLSGYYSNDEFRLSFDTLYQYSNLNATLNWSHVYSPKFFGELSLGFASFDNTISSESNAFNAFELYYENQNMEFKYDLTHYLNRQHKLDGGIFALTHDILPGRITPGTELSNIAPKTIDREYALEYGFYLSDNFEITDRLSVDAGIRFSLYNQYGPATIFQYADGQPRSEETLIDSVTFDSGESIVHYSGPEYRLSGRYAFNQQQSVKFSYNRTRQYIHLLQNTVAVSPTSTWKLSDPYIRPAVGDQVSLGYYRNMLNNTVEFSLEGYYKWIDGIVDFKTGAQLLLNDKLETDILNATGKAYGVEVLLNKKYGKLTGWLSYTWSRAFNRLNSEFPENEVNDGDFFPANYDKPHNFTLVGNYRFTRRFSFSTTFTYSTGRPVTLPVTSFYFGNQPLLHFSDRNQFRIRDYIRWDVAFQLDGNHRVNKLMHGSWSFSIYNLLGRDNVYSVFFTNTNRGLQGFELSIFANAIPTLTYNFKINP